MKKRALGKGLKAFLPEEYGILKEEKFVELDIEKLKPNFEQPRKYFDPESIEELAHSIKQTGILQPIVAVPEEDHYKIILGERRWRAAQKAGLEKIPVLIRLMKDEQQIEASLVENLQREDLNPMEIAEAYNKLAEELGYTQEEISEKVGKDRTSVANYMRLLKLPPSIQKLLSNGDLAMGHARALISVGDPELQVKLAKTIIAKKLTVRKIEKLVAQTKKEPEKKSPHPMDPDLMAFKDKLIEILGTKVDISGTADRGTLKISYYSLDELNRIYEIIKGDHQ
ncbi:MAG TPA: ParB/RepB/Spo0J family partition protein [Candidatus Aminicenantes bacterium]|nr:ParB/RepB/Spo0J family partition protein [Candidatus Aminicenantes bacterium]